MPTMAKWLVITASILAAAPAFGGGDKGANGSATGSQPARGVIGDSTSRQGRRGSADTSARRPVAGRGERSGSASSQRKAPLQWMPQSGDYTSINNTVDGQFGP